MNIEIVDARSPVVPAVTGNSAVYFVLTNTSAKPVVVIGAASPDFAMAHLHRTSLSGGIATMALVEHLVIPPRGRVVFGPASLHVMLMGAKRHPVVGEAIPVSLMLKDGSRVDFRAPVIKPGSRTGGQDS